MSRINRDVGSNWRPRKISHLAMPTNTPRAGCTPGIINLELTCTDCDD
jgi:hypothetical protein